MKIAFHTNAFVWAGQTDLLRIADFALESGYTALEVGPGFDLDVNLFESALKKLPISNFIYARNFIDDDQEKADYEKGQLYERMKFAAQMGVEKFVFSTGISRRLSLPVSGGMDPMASMEPVVDFMNETMDLAEKLNLTMLLENCPMYRNVATSPVMWHALFDRIGSDRLGICYDASHFIWQMIDVYEPIKEFADRIHHIHLKDTELNHELIRRLGILHNVGSERGFVENQWWRHTLIGRGEIDWQRFKKELDDIHYEDSLSFEMEDYEFELDEKKVKEGLKIQREFLKENWLI